MWYNVCENLNFNESSEYMSKWNPASLISKDKALAGESIVLLKLHSIRSLMLKRDDCERKLFKCFYESIEDDSLLKIDTHLFGDVFGIHRRTQMDVFHIRHEKVGCFFRILKFQRLSTLGKM